MGVVIIKTVKVLREEKSLTQEELAKKLGISQNYLSEIEGEKKNIPFILGLKISLYFKVCPFLFADDNMLKIIGECNLELCTPEFCKKNKELLDEKITSLK